MKNGSIYKTGLLMAVCLFLFISANAQEFTVKGRLVDSASSKPVSDATVSIQEPAKKISKTLVSDKEGAFQTKLQPGNYVVMITHTGFRKKGKHLTVTGQDVDLATIQMIAVAKTLTGVTVTATRPMVEQQGDRLIYNVEDDPSAKSESASDILRKTPYVTVDGEGNIQVNGQGNFKVLLNGRETALFSQNVKEALKGFPGATISKIEVITSPSAKYDAEGVGGIINIITKKKLAGYNGTVNTSYRTTGDIGGGLNFNLKTGRLGISAMYNTMRNAGIESYQMGVTTPVNPMAFKRREVGGDRETELFFQQGNLELSYDLDSTHTLVVYGNLGKHRNEQENNYTINTLFSNGTSRMSPYQLETQMAMPTHGFGSDFIKKYKGNPQKELTFRFNASFNKQHSFNHSQQEIGGADRFLLNDGEAFNSEYTVQADLIEPMNKTTRLETGVKGILRSAWSDFESMVKFNKADPYQIDPANTNRFSYSQNVFGGYASLSKTIKTLNGRLGLRVEHTDVDGDFKSTKTVVEQKYTDFIPNLMVSKQFSKTMNSNFNYTFRLGRPSIGSLNPFVNNSDSLYKSSGNPDLGPQYIHSMTLQTRFFKGPKFISIQTGFNLSNNLIIQNPTYDQSTGVTTVRPANAGQLREFVLGFSSNLPVGTKWNFSLNANGRFARMRNSLQTDWSGTTAGGVNGNFSFKATPNFTIASNGGYFVPLRMPNSTFPDNYHYGLNFIQKFYKQKLTVTLTAMNFLQEKRTMVFRTETVAFLTENRNTVDFRSFGLSLNYNFGKLKENVSKKKGITNDDKVE